MAKNKYLLFLISFIVLVFGGGNLVSALEVKLPGLQENPTLVDYISYLFTFAISLAGILSLISFTIGAISLVNPDPEAHGNAKDRMKGAALGLALTLASFLIIKTINPQLIEPTLTPLSEIPGVYLTSETQIIACPSIEPTIPEGIKQIKYVCSDNEESGIFIWFFPKENHQANDKNYSGVTVQKLDCGGDLSISGKSLMWEYEKPGVYYCMEGCSGNICKGYMSRVHTSSENVINDPFKKNIKGAMFVDEPAKDRYYGAIFHQVAGLGNGGVCTAVLTGGTDGNEHCEGFDIKASAVDIFSLNEDAGNSGDGVTFYSEDKGWDTGKNAGAVAILDEEILFPFYSGDPQAMIFDYTGVIVSDKKASAYKTFKDRPGSIRIKGDYLVALYAKNNSTEYCQTFTENVPSLDATQILPNKNYQLDKIYIVPTIK